MTQTQPGHSRSPSQSAPFLTLDDLFWFLYLFPLRMLSGLGLEPLLHGLGELFQFRVVQRAELTARRIRTANAIPEDQAPAIARRMLQNSKTRMLDDLML